MTADGRFSGGPISLERFALRERKMSLICSSRNPSYLYANMVSPSVTSGCANSDAADGASLPTKGIAKCIRLRGIRGSDFSARLQSCSFIKPNDTRSTFCKMCGNTRCSHTRIIFKRPCSSRPWSRSCSLSDSLLFKKARASLLSALTFSASRYLRTQSCFESIPDLSQ